MRKKGPWTPEEDRELVEYVKTHGVGRWNMVERSTSLKRCGKSCRLRWCNHLQPNVRKGPLTPKEERILIQLHARLGNRWAQIATQLPGRSDNEVKNYWHTRIKRRARSGLPLYPESIVPQNNHTQTILSASPDYETHFPNPNERSLLPPVPSYPNPENSEFRLSPQLSLGPFNYYSNPVLPNSSFSHYDTNNNSINRDDTNFILGSTSYSPPLSSTLSSSSKPYPNTQSLLDLSYQFQSQSSNFNSNPNLELSMPNSYPPPLSSTLASSSMCYPNTQSIFSLPCQLQSESSNFKANHNPESSIPNSYSPVALSSPFSSSSMHYPNIESLLSLPYEFQSEPSNFNANPNTKLSTANFFEAQSSLPNNEVELSSIQKLLRYTPAFCESDNGANSMNMPNFDDPQYCFEPPYTNDDMLEDIIGATQTSVPSAILPSEGEEIFMGNNDYSLSFANTTAPHTSVPSAILPGEGQEILMRNIDSRSSFTNTTTGMLDPVNEIIPVDVDFRALLGDSPMEFPTSDEWYYGLCGNGWNEDYQN